MATKYKTRRHVLEESGEYAVVHEETSSDIVLNADGTTVQAHVDNKTNPHGVTAAQVKADPEGTAASAVAAHNTAEDAHADIREELATKASTSAMNTALAGKANKAETETALSKKADLGADGKVPSSQLPPLDYIPTAEKGTNGGVATLDGNGKVTETQLPENLVEAEDTGLAGAVTVDADTLKGHGPEYFASVAQMTAAIQSAIQATWEASY